MRLVSTRDIYVIPDAKARPITLALTNLITPSGALHQPEQEHFDARLRSFMHDYANTSPDQLAMTSYTQGHSPACPPPSLGTSRSSTRTA